jgi:hypothetical protein
MSQTTRQADPDIVAVVHRAGGRWRGLMATTRTGQPRLVETRSFDADRDLQTWIDEHQAGEVLSVLPAAAVVCRTCALPAAEPDQLLQALHLQAEAHALSNAPEHRLAMAVLDPAPGETSRSGLLLAWPENAEAPVPATEAPLRFTPDVAALAALVDGLRPDEPLVWVDRADGSVAIAFSHANGAAFRATHEDLNEDEWSKTVGRVLAETGLSVGHTGSFVESSVHATTDRLTSLARGETRLLAPEEIRDAAARQVAGVSTDAGWWSDYGILLGALLARRGTLQPLTQMRASAPIEYPSIATRVATQLSNTRTATWAAVIAVVAILFGPMATSWGRLQVLQWRHPDIQQKLESVELARLKADMYRTMGQRRWTMTKLLADLSCCTPVGVDIEQIRIDQGNEITIVGKARDVDGLLARDVAALMQSMLNGAGIFRDAKYQISTATSIGDADFTMTADVVQAHVKHPFSVEQDFGAHTLRQRKDNEPVGDDEFLWGKLALGEIGSATPAPPPVRTPSAAREPDAVAMTDPEDDGGNAETVEVADAGRDTSRPDFGRGLGGSSRNPGTRSPGSQLDNPRPPSQDIPPPLTQEQVDAMDSTEVMQMWAKVAAARPIAKAMDDDELHSRLVAEFEMLKKRKTELSKERDDE